MPCRPELILKRSDNRADILAFVERRKYNYDFQRHVTFFKKFWVGLHSRSYAPFVGEANPLSFQLFLERTVLFDEIVDDYFKPTPAGSSFR